MNTWTLEELLERERAGIVDSAVAAVRHVSAWHYEALGADETQRRLERLYDHVVVAVTRRNLGPIVEYAERLAAERYAGGYPLAEVQSAFNALEEALWERVVAGLPTDDVPPALTILSSAFGVAKDTMACAYVAAAAHSGAPALDVAALSSGL